MRTHTFAAAVLCAALAAGGQGAAAPSAPPVPPVTASAATPPAPVLDAAERRAVAAALAGIAARPAVFTGRDGMRFDVKNVFVEPTGVAHVRFLRAWRGLPVLAGDLVVHLDAAGRLYDHTLASPVAPDVATVPRIATDAAQRRALAAFAGTHAAPGGVRLVVDAHPPAARLAWDALVTGPPADGTPAEAHTVVDALTGAVLREWDDVHTEKGTGHGLHNGTVPLETARGAAGTGFVLRDDSRGGVTTKDGFHFLSTRAPDVPDDDNEWADGTGEQRFDVAVDAHYGGQQTWDYYKRAHGYLGVDGDGAKFTLVVHEGLNYANATWSNGCMCGSFGDGDGDFAGPLTALDVVGHEITHGVTSATAGLEYRGESGGLNEATSDIVATLVEFAAKNPKDPGDYLIGEKVLLGGQPLRWMDDPKKDRYSLSCWSERADRTGVHSSSGIGNHFFYLLAVGSGRSKWGNSPTCHGAPAVRGLGNTTAGRIWFHALSRYMTSTTDYSEARVATTKAAAELYGARSVQVRTVAAAWRAVDVH